MRESYRVFFKSLIISLMFCAILVGIGYYFINKNLKPVQTAEEKVPYTQESPQNAGVMLEIDNEKTFFYLDFDKQELYVSLTPSEEKEGKIYGYDVDFRIDTDYTVLRDIVDYVGGIELKTNDLTFRYTGVQIVELYNKNLEQKREIIKQVCKRIANSKVALDFFSKIIENSNTDLSIPDCYFWEREFDILCRNLKIID